MSSITRVYKHVLIFCQASKDLKYTLHLYKKNIEAGNSCSIVVREVIDTYRFVEELNLNLTCFIFMRTFSLKTIKGVLDQRKESQRIIKKLSEYYFDEVCFFSSTFDVMTPYIITRINHVDVCFYNDFEYKNVLQKASKLTFAEYIRSFVALYCFGLTTFVSDIQRQLLIDVDLFVTKKRTLNDVEVDSRYLFKFNGDDKRYILFLDSNDQRSDVLSESQKCFESFYNIATSLNYTVVVKGHPRLGLSDYIAQYECCIIGKKVPSEFLDISSFHFFFSILSASLASLPKDRTFSLIEICEVRNRASYVNYLKGLGLSTDQFVKSNQCLEVILDSEKI